MTTAPDRPQRGLLGLAWLALVCIEVVTQLSLKFAGRVTGGFDFSARAFAAAVSTGWIWIAATSYIAGFIAWMVILDRTRLSRAYPMSAMVFVAMMAASRLVLHESIGTFQTVGAVLIVAGILQLGGTQSEPADARDGAPTGSH